jgi:hypothetical protein
MAKPRKEQGEQGAVRLLAPYRFYDEDGQMREWFAGQCVEGDDAALLTERQAPVEAV